MEKKACIITRKFMDNDILKHSKGQQNYEKNNKIEHRQGPSYAGL